MEKRKVKSNLPGRHGIRQDEKNGAMHGSSIEFLTTIRPLISFHPVLLPFLLLLPRLKRFESSRAGVESGSPFISSSALPLLTPASTANVQARDRRQKDTQRVVLVLLSIVSGVCSGRECILCEYPCLPCD